MSRLVMSLLEALGLAFCEKGRKALQGYASFGDVLAPVAEGTLKELRKHMPSDQIRVALAETASMPPEEYAELLESVIKGLCRVQSVPFKAELHDYLAYLPLTIQQMFHRPSDPAGHNAPDKLDFYKPEQLLPFLPPRRPHFQPGARPDGLDHWELTGLRGLGECGEVWLGDDDEQPEHSPAALKFAIEKEARKRFLANAELFEKVFELNEIKGVVPLRSVYLQSDPPCLEYAFVSGYDLTGLLHEWSWRHLQPQIAAAGKLFKRIVEVIGQAHALGVVHRDLKPSNVLVHPTEGGRFSLWITDFGWGQIEAERSLHLHRTGGTPAAEQKRLALRGAYTPLYASPQQTKNERPAPTDDVHALGVIWHQLLKRDPNATAPVGDDWAEEFVSQGLSRHHAKLLTACVATRPDRRPADANVLLEMLIGEEDSAIGGPAGEGSKVISLGLGSSTKHAPLSTTSHAKSASAKSTATAVAPPPRTVAAGSASAAAATMLGNSGYHQGVTKSEPTGATSKVVRNSIGMSFVPIPAGTFEMGADSDEPGRCQDETPKHTVRITSAFYMSIYPVTQSQYERLMGRNPAFFHHRNGGSNEFPVESVIFQDAERFCRKLAHYGEEDAKGRIYRLPTEAEWEYACRAGTTSPYHYGEDLTIEDAHYAALTLKGQGHPCIVGQHTPNAWGLFDMHGNVEEWVSDWYGPDYYIVAVR